MLREQNMNARVESSNVDNARCWIARAMHWTVNQTICIRVMILANPVGLGSCHESPLHRYLDTGDVFDPRDRGGAGRRQEKLGTLVSGVGSRPYPQKKRDAWSIVDSPTWQNRRRFGHADSHCSAAKATTTSGKKMVKTIQFILSMRRPQRLFDGGGTFRHSTDQLQRNTVSKQLWMMSSVPRPGG